jgi:hypothetical protein
MRNAHLLLLCLVPIAACSGEETDHGPYPAPEPRTFFATCEGQPELGDTWERRLSTHEVQLDGEGNVYLFGEGPIELDCGDPESRPFLGGWSHVTKLGPGGDTRWIRAWEQDYASGVVTSSGETLVMVQTPGIQVLDPDGAISVEQARRAGWPALAPTPSGFLLSGFFFQGDDVGLEGVDFTTSSPMAFVSVMLDRDLTPRHLTEAPVIVSAEPNGHAAMAMNNGDVLTAHIEPVTYDPRLVLTRRANQPWQRVIPIDEPGRGPRLWDLGDDTFLVQTKTALWRFAGNGDLLWTREYADALSIDQYSRSPGRTMAAAANPEHIVVGYWVSEEDGPVETSDGPLTPLGRDIVFSFIDVETGVPDTVRLMQREGDDAVGSIALDRDGALVVTTTHELSNQQGSSFVERLRIEP